MINPPTDEQMRKIEDSIERECDANRPPIYPMQIGDLNFLYLKTAKGRVVVNADQLARAEMSGGELFLQFSHIAQIKVEGANLYQLENALTKLKRRK